MVVALITLISNAAGIKAGYLAGRFPGMVGWLVSPEGWRIPPTYLPNFPYALDNGVYGAWQNGREWEPGPLMKVLADVRMMKQKPLWLVCPDWVGDRDRTITLWREWSPQLRGHCPLAFAVQDGMAPSDVPDDANVVFVGGSTRWKWDTVAMWARNFPRVHVGRVNSPARLRQCADLGVESTDGTGWMRGSAPQWRGLVRLLEELQSGKRHQPELIACG